jgi:hypothetical protein
MHRLLNLFFLFSILPCFTFATDIVFPQADSYLISYELAKKHTKKSISEVWKKNKIPKIAIPVKNDVDIYEIVYKAPWIDGSWIEASGIVFIPRTGKPLPTMMYGHGTQIHKHREISDDDAQLGICLGFATNGYLSLFPDYYGIGKGTSRHLYQHSWSEAMSFVYMLYAVEELKYKLDFERNDQLFLTGYSQGGHASFAAHKYLEKLNDPRFKVTASSPMSGAYDMTGEQEKFMHQEYPRPFYLPYLLISYQVAYNIIDIDNVYDMFRSPYDTLLPYYFEDNQDKDLYGLDKIMPKIPKEVAKQKYIDEYDSDPDYLFKQKLRENNLTDWAPRAPVMLCYCKGDREVSYKNSEVAYANMKSMGVENIKLNNLSDYLDHNSCAGFAVLATKSYFDRYKKNGKNPKMKDVPAFKKMLVNTIKKKMEKKYIKEGEDFHFDNR